MLPTDRAREALQCGDSLEILRCYVPAESADLVCLNHPVPSNASHDVLSQEPASEEAASDGFCRSPGGKHARLQLLIVEDPLAGKGTDYPPLKHVSRPLGKAPKVPAKTRAARLLDAVRQGRSHQVS